jgi:hypothetical protein
VKPNAFVVIRFSHKKRTDYFIWIDCDTPHRRHTNSLFLTTIRRADESNIIYSAKEKSTIIFDRTFIQVMFQFDYVNIIDLPDEILMTISKKPKPTKVFNKLVGVNKRIDRVVSDRFFTTQIIDLT